MPRDPFTVLVLLGTGRLGAVPGAPHGVLAEAWAGLDWAAPENAALAGMALAAAARCAGAGARPGAVPDELAPPESLPACPPRAALALRRMLAGDQAEFLGEWLAEAARRGERAAFRDLPDLLRLAARERGLRAAIAPVLGVRGVWLARRTPGWGEVLESAAVPDAAWETGAPAERVAWLRQTRADDAARAAAALAKAWGEIAGEERERLLAVVAETPGEQDLALLEGEALRDRRREVRLTARAALMRLPGSAFAQRARSRMEALVTLEGGLPEPRLILRPPEAYDPAWKADGIEEKAPPGTGQRAHWARQWLGAVPLSAWTARFGLTPETLFAANRDDEWSEVVLLGWLDAALAAPETENAEAFALYILGRKAWPKGAPDPLAVLLRLLAVLPPESAARVLAAAEGRAEEDGLYFELLFRSSFPLPEAGAEGALERCIDAFQAKPYPRLQANHARALARRLPPAALGGALRRLAALPEPASPTEELMRALEFRQQLHLAFNPPPP